MSYNFDEFKKDKVSKPRNAGWSNWAKFEKVGDKAQGYIRDVFFKAQDGEYPEARGITLEHPAGTFTNVSIKRIPFVLKDTDDFHLDDPLTIELTELKKSATKGYSPTKVLSFYGAKLPENANKPTVFELDRADQNLGGTKSADKEEVATDAPTVKTDEVPFP